MASVGTAAAAEPAQSKTPSTKVAVDGKENRPTGGGRAGKRPWSTVSAASDDIRVLTSSNEREKLSERRAVNVAFEKMLVSWPIPQYMKINKYTRSQDDLQVPSTLRPKLQTLESPVKHAMLRSAQTLSSHGGQTSPPQTPKTLRRTQSGSSLASPKAHFRAGSTEFELVSAPGTPTRKAANVPLPDTPKHGDTFASRGVSLDIPRPALQQAHSSTSSTIRDKKAKAVKDKDVIPGSMCQMLVSTKSTDLKVDKLKKLRVLLRNEAAR